MSCAFCGIARGAAPAHLVCETEELVAFADHRPIRPGHVQIVPRDHVRCFEEIAAPVGAALFLLAQRIARAQKRLWGVERVGFVFSGHDVAHAHAHLIPLHEATDLTSLRYFALAPGALIRRDLRVPEDALAATADRLHAALAGEGRC